MLAAAATLAVSGNAAGPNVKGKISGQEKLVPEVYAEATKPESRRWTWREPSPSVDSKWRTLSAAPSRDICIAALSGAGQGAQEPIRMTVTGGRVFPTTIVVAPNTQLVFKNFDPFKHRLYVVGQNTMKADDLQAQQSRSWTAPGPGLYQVRDELFPSVRTWIVVDNRVVASVFPGRDGAFGFTLPDGEYILQAYFQGKPVGRPAQVNPKANRAFDVKDPLNVSEAGGDQK